jgi:LysR family transcriptional regulator (chromosome initiation inhibitor)
MHLLQFLRRRALLEEEFLADLDANAGPVRVALAVNNDTLATWLLPALAPALIAEQLLVEFVLDNQGHTFSLLERGQAIACISTEAAPMRGCSVTALGVMRYRMVAAPAFARHWFPGGLQREAARGAPVMVFDRKDTLQTQFLLHHLGLPDGAYPFHYVPSSEAFALAIRLGLGYGMLPLEQCAALLQSGDLVDLAPDAYLDVPLYWHAWRVQPQRVERMGATLAKAARAMLLPMA